MGHVVLTREIVPAIDRCELTHLARVPIDVEKAQAQHVVYERVLERLGCVVERLPAAPEMADSVFIEDIALVLDEIAIITRPGAPSRRAEVPEVEAAVARFRSCRRIEPPGTLDGGDVLAVGKAVFVGCSTRTNGEAVSQLRRLLAPFGYAVEPVVVRGALHLKSAVTAVGDSLLLVNRGWAPVDVLGAFELLETHPLEPHGANALRVGDSIVYPQAFPRTREVLERRGLDVRCVDMSELAKAEGAVTCCSLVFNQLTAEG